MGAVLSCLRGLDEEEAPLLSERTPLMGNRSDTIESSGDQADKHHHREQKLLEIIGSTGESLIDINSISQPNQHIQPARHTIGDLRRLIASVPAYTQDLTADYKNSSGDLSLADAASGDIVSLIVRNDLKSLIPFDDSWLTKLAEEADKAVLSDCQMTPVGELVLNF
ncbi:hypothetical protein NADFUDRAFT_51746 [Nadsonia fulvescens var. elongata DSM 6958]|uniref:Uncharacterized protein n=1 Tax=Nadsonia fulvescens var. elongata DSM 6958 TaxID=857566 RepID=A0A1E3PIN0_9ASCO|nr:hypothetical protein NADFUDRAFT_51746 [Nadsonia fulvescens var. elongata DSM 6958]